MTLTLETILVQYHQHRDAELATEANRIAEELNSAIAEYERIVPADLRSILTNPTYTCDEGEIIARQTIKIVNIPTSIWIYTYLNYRQPIDEFGIPKGPEFPPIFIALGEPNKGYTYKRRFEFGDGSLANWPLALGEMVHWELQRIKLNQAKPQTASMATNHAGEAVGLLNLAERIESEQTSAYVATVALANAAVAQLEQTRRIADALEYLNHIDNGPLARLALLTERIAAATDKLSRAAHSYNGSGYINVRGGRI